MLSELECGRCGFQTRSGQTKDYEIGICYFSPKHETVRRTSKDGFFKGISREIKTSIGMFYQYVYIDGRHINIANLSHCFLRFRNQDFPTYEDINHFEDTYANSVVCKICVVKASDFIIL